MPGIAGILKMSSRNVNINAILTKMCQQMKHEDWYSKDTFMDKSIGLARIGLGIFNPEPQPIFNENKDLCIMMDGEIYDYKSLKDNLINKGHKFMVGNDPEFILHLYEEYGTEFVYRLNGSFILTIWDSKKQELLIANDRYGLRPLYYSMHNGYILFSSEILAILRDDSFKRVANDEAVLDYLFFRRILGTKTLLKGINLLPAASIMTCKSDKIFRKNYWDFNFEELQEEKNYHEEYYIQKMSMLIERAIKRQLEGNYKIGSSLTGGFDTRIVTANIVKKLGPIHTYTWGGLNCKDVMYAPKVAENLGVQHHFFEYRPEDLISGTKEHFYLLEGLVDPDSFGLINNLKKIRSFLDIELGGIGGGELLRGCLITKQMEDAENEEELFKSVYNYLSVNTPEEVFNTEWYQKIKGSSANRLRLLFDKYNDKQLLQKVEHFLLRESLSSYMRSNFVLKNSYFEFRAPFYDNELIDFAQKVPLTLRKNNRIMIKIFLRMFPKLAKISFEAAGCPVYTNRFQPITQKYKKQLRRIICHPLKTGSTNYRLVDYGRWFQDNKQIQEYTKDILLSSSAKARPYFNSEIIQGILEDQFTGKKDNWRLIIRLIILELWHRLFFGD